MEREAFTTTKLRLHLYSDEDCTALYDDNRSDSIRGIKGYNLNGTYFNPFVSFSPPFYTCSTCKPQFISQYFTKDYTYWIDDDAAQNGKVSYQYFDDWVDDFQTLDDDTWQAVSFAKKYHKNDDDYYSRRVMLSDEVSYCTDMFECAIEKVYFTCLFSTQRVFPVHCIRIYS